MLERPRPDATGEDDDVGCRHLPEDGVRAQPEHAVLGTNLGAVVADEDDVEGRDALEDLVGAHRIERGHAREEGNGDLEATGGLRSHAGVPSMAVARKRRR